MTPSSAGKRRRPVGQELDSSPLAGTKPSTSIKRRKLGMDGSSPSTRLKNVVVETTDSTPKRPRAGRKAKILSKLSGGKPKEDRVPDTTGITAGPPSLEETAHENGLRQTRALRSQKVVRKDLSERQMNTNEDTIEVDIDDTTCKVCGGGDSTEPNKILLCDSCDNAFHQECYDVPVIPGGDWFCGDCLPSDGGGPVESEALTSPGKRRRPAGRGKDRRKASDTAVSAARRQPGQEPGSSPLPGTIGGGNDSGKASNTAVSPRASRRPRKEPDSSPLLVTKSPASIKPRKLGVDRSAHGAAMEKFDPHLRIMKKLLLERLTGRRALQLRGLDDAYEKVHQVVEQTVLAGEGNSMLIIGARGCGKTTLVEQVVSDLSNNHREKFHVVRLNGFIHVDDKLALRDIWRQLGREMEVEDELTSKVSNYADTLTSLLALLSHPSEISEVEADQTANSVIFILDEFDLFTSHPRQTLLYNLFDVAQSRKAPIAVLGLTTRIDVVESLEKRVKSRFSHRYAHISLPRNLPAYWEICKQGLLVGTDELIQGGVGSGVNNLEEFQSFWESMIETLYSEDLVFRDYLQMHFYRSKSVTSFLTSCMLPVAGLTPTTLPLSGKSFVLNNFLSPPDSKLHLLQSLSDLDLALLIAAARLDIILDTDTCNFTMAYDEYSRLTSKHKIQTSSTGVAAIGAGAKIWGREVAIGSWEHLIGCELLMPAGTGGGTATTGRDIGREWRMWKADVGLEEISGSVDGLSGIMAKWCREI